MPDTNPIEHVLATAAGNFRIRCCWSGDRFAHQFELSHLGEWFELLKSVEGDGETPWPPSAPIQELHRQDWQQNDCLLGVGKAGHGHWSLSLEPLSDQSGFRFDFACRASFSGTGEFLANTYMGEKLVGSTSVPNREASASVTTLVSTEAPGYYLEIQVIAGASFEPSQTSSEWVVKAPAPTEEGAQTVRWIYECRLHQEL